MANLLKVRTTLATHAGVTMFQLQLKFLYTIKGIYFAALPIVNLSL